MGLLRRLNVIKLVLDLFDDAVPYMQKSLDVHFSISDFDSKERFFQCIYTRTYWRPLQSVSALVAIGTSVLGLFSLVWSMVDSTDGVPTLSYFLNLGSSDHFKWTPHATRLHETSYKWFQSRFGHLLWAIWHPNAFIKLSDVVNGSTFLAKTVFKLRSW